MVSTKLRFFPPSSFTEEAPRRVLMNPRTLDAESFDIGKELGADEKKRRWLS